MREKKDYKHYLGLGPTPILEQKKLLYSSIKGDKFKEYYELFEKDRKLPELFSSETFEIIVDELENSLDSSEQSSSNQKRIDILIIGPGQGRIEIPFMRAIFKSFFDKIATNTIEINIHIVEPVNELLTEFSQYLKILMGEFHLLDKMKDCITESADRLEDLDLGKRQFNVILVFFVLQYVEAQFSAIKKMNDCLKNNGLILWGEESGWLKPVDGLFNSKNSNFDTSKDAKALKAWEDLWEKFHGMRYQIGKPYTNPIKASDHSLVEIIYRGMGYKILPQKEVQFNLKKSIKRSDLEDWFKIKMWMPMFFSLTEEDYSNKIFSELEGEFKDFEGPRTDTIKLICLQKKQEKNSNYYEYYEPISHYFQKTKPLSNIFRFEENITSNDLFKQLNPQNDFHSLHYETTIINRRLYVISNYLFKLINKNIHIDYVLWQPNYGDFSLGTFLGGLPLAFCHNKDEEYEKMYMGWYIFYFLSRQCLSIDLSFSNFLFKEIPYFQEISIKKLKEIEEHQSVSLNNNTLEIRYVGLRKSFFNNSYVNLIYQFGEKLFTHKNGCIYIFDKILELINEFKKNQFHEFSDLSSFLNEEYKNWFTNFGVSLKKQLKQVFASFNKKIADQLLNDFLKNLFAIHLINNGNWSNIKFKLSFIFKKKQVYEGYLLFTNVASNNLEDDEIKIIDSLIDEASSLIAVKDTLYMSYRLIKREVYRNAIRSAIAAIMSRNMSHNIGSHVIADLVSKGVTASEGDLNSFFRYLQNRMDFIAQITTEFPEWTYPAYFNKEIMRIFYENYLLIDRIGVSEGLKAYKWPDDWKNGCIRGKIIVRTGIKTDGTFKWVINEYQMGNLEDDLQLAVPGGIVGYHAFYIIIENMIRNSAKHDYAVRVPKMLDDKDSELKSLPGCRQRQEILIIEKKNDSIEMTSIASDKKRDITSDEKANSDFFKQFKAVVIESSCFKDPNIEELELKNNNNKKYPVDDLYRIYIVCHDEKCDGCAFDSDKCWDRAVLSYHLLSYHEWKGEEGLKGKEGLYDKLKIEDNQQRYEAVLDFLLKIPLRINIRIDDIPDKNYVWVTIWDDMPQCTQYDFDKNIDSRHEVSGGVPDERIENINAKINLFGFLNDCLRESFIRETGELKKENWGLAELKICAGFLQNRKPEEIGGSGGEIIDYGNDCFSLTPKYIIDEGDNPNNDYPKMLIKAIPVDKTGIEMPQLAPGEIYFLGYRFWMKKPKIVAITGDKKENKNKCSEQGEN